ncbi:hypothetical protein JXB12_03225 [candidate division KSB1 bacterium]|nr:hypothetical protein [candidate division KSB1 bacterium]
MTRSRIIGLFLIFFGGILLLEQHGIVDVTIKTIIGSLFIFMSLIILLRRKHYNNKRLSDYASILFLIFGIIFIIDSIYPIANEIFIALVLLLISVYFFRIHFRKSAPLWPVFPGGLFFIFATMYILDIFRLLQGSSLWFVFVFGIGCIFWYLYFMRHERRRLRWAIYPAAIVTIGSFFILSRTWDTMIAVILFPASIIVMGVYLVLINLRQS